MDRRLIIGVVATEFSPALGGMERHAEGLCRALSKEHSVVVFTTAEHADVRYGEFFSVESVLSFDIEKDLKYLRAIKPDFWLILNAGYASLSLKLRAPVFVYCHGNDFLNPWVSSHNILTYRLPKTLAGTPFLWRYSKYAEEKFRRKRISKGLMFSAGIFVNSSYTRDVLNSTFPKCGKVAKISHPAVGDEFFANSPFPVRNSMMPRNKNLRIFTAARLSSVVPEKNIDRLICAISQLPDSLNAVLTIAGDGDLLAEFKTLARDLGISEKIQFLGRKTSTEIQKNLQESDLFVLVSLESFGIVYAEAAACGVPALANGKRVTDAVIPGTTGLLTTGAQVEDIVCGIKRFVDTRSEFDPLRLVEFATRFKQENIASELLSSIKSALEVSR